MFYKFNLKKLKCTMKTCYSFKLYLFLFLQLIFFPYGSHAEEKFKFGNVSKEEMEMKTCANDSSANAVVLYEEGYTNFEYLEDFYYITELTERIKILKQEGVDLATVKTQYYARGTDRERISDIQAWAYNLENGKIEKTKLDKKFIFEEKVDDHYNQIKFAIPNVKVGTVIEYKIKKTSPFYYRLPEWNFQRTSIPVKFSRYQIAIPSYFIYHIVSRGYEKINVNEKQIMQSFTIADRGTSGIVSVSAKQLTYTAENLPALNNENFVWNASDYMTSMFFELAATNFPDVINKKYSLTWEDIDKTLQEDYDFVKDFTKKTSINEEIKQFENITDEKSKIEAIYKLVKGKVRWNGEYAFYSGSKDALKNGVGTNAQINALLISALNDAGIKSYAVLLRRRSQGRIYHFMPSLDKLTTFVVASETKDGTVYYLDGSATHGGLNMLPSDLLVDAARTFHLNESGKMVDLTKLTKNIVAIGNIAKLNSDGTLNCDITTSYKNLPAYHFKNDLYNLKDSTEYIEKFQTDNNVKVTKYAVQGQNDNMSNTVTENISIKKEGLSRGDFIYLNPLIIPHTTKNTFTQSERKLPIEFESPTTFLITTRIQIPDDYTVEELPKPGKFTLDENAAGFSYLINQTGNEIQINYKFFLNEILFPFSSYPGIKEFWGELTSKNKELIVLKKK